MTSLIGFTRAQRRTGLGAIAIMLVLALSAWLLAFGVTASAATPNALPGSTFQSGNGDLVTDTAGASDWVNAPNRTIDCDLPDSGCFTQLGRTLPTSDNS